MSIKTAKVKIDDEEIMTSDVATAGDNGEWFVTAQIVGTVTIKGKEYTFDKVIEIELDRAITEAG